MGYLLKEALKTLCGVNKWSYAVFWKIGCQNPRIINWEEFYYEHIIHSGLPHISETKSSELAIKDWETCWVFAEACSSQLRVQARDRVQSLLNKMKDNQIHVIGQGLVGRAAFTGSHQWILLENYTVETHPPEVLNEVYQQFSAGIQTLAVIPVLPHGVVQLGSSSTILEDIEFVNEVRTLVRQLGYVHGALLPDNYATKESSLEAGVPSSHENSLSTGLCVTNSTLLIADSCSQQISSSPASQLVGQTSHKMAQIPVKSNDDQCQAQASLYISKFGYDPQSSSGPSDATDGRLRLFSNVTVQDPSNDTLCASNSFVTTQQRKSGGLTSSSRQIADLSRTKASTPEFSDHMFTGRYDDEHNSVDEKCTQIVLVEGKERIGNDLFQDEHSFEQQSSITTNAKYENSCVRPSSGDDLFAIFGVDVRSKLCDRSWNDSINSEGVGLDTYSVNEGNPVSEIFSVTDSDNLLDAVVSRAYSSAKQTTNDNASCTSTLTKQSISSASNTMQVDLVLGLNKSLTKAGALGSCSNYGSQISSWIQVGDDMKRCSSVSTIYSKKPEEMGKSNRKRLKPGENPRPRPKDRQMIQDRVKELREIIPNGAKCSIDALLERTIKHMLFLQSVTKHADTLNQTGESKFRSRESGLILKGNFGGGATWAYEVGSESMVCPIIVEDLNPPRQFLVEMLCEKRGLFLEIADIVRGLGLTILKGMIETQSDKIWARFTVEANRVMTRMEIFISLVRLLEETIKTGGCNINQLHR